MRSGILQLLRLAGLFLTVWLVGKFLLPLVLPFLLGAGLALAAEPMARFFRRQLRLPRSAASGIAVSAVFSCLGILGMLLGTAVLRELQSLAGILPELTESAMDGLTAVQEKLIRFSEGLPGELGRALRQSLTALFSEGSALPDKIMGYLLGLGGAILAHIPKSFLSVGTAVISGYMISAKLPRIRKWLVRRVPREKLKRFLEGAKKLRRTFVSFLKAQAKLSAVTFCLLLAGFLILGIPHAPVWALTVALVDAFPVLGTGTVLLPWAVVSALQGNAARALGLGGIYTILCVTRSVLEPKLLGKHLGLDPLVTLMALYAGFRLFGLGGMILAPMVTVSALQLIPGTSEDG